MNTPPTKIEILDPFLALPPYDEREFFDAEIAPLLKAVLELAKQKEIPLLVLAVPMLNQEKQIAVVHAYEGRAGATPSVFIPSLLALRPPAS